MKKQYYKDRADAIQLYVQSGTQEILTEEKLATLPKAFQRYFRLCGFVDKPIAMNGDVIWEESFIKLKPDQGWKPLTTLQFNSVKPIMRTAYMKVNRMFFAGKDLYKDGAGSMKGKILNLFSVIDASGKELSQSSLIISFAEMLLLSGYAFQDYVRYQEIDDRTVQVQLSDHGHTVNGVFYFDQEGMFDYFQTDERFFDKGKGVYEKKRFIARVNNYKKIGKAYQPESISCLWILDGQEYEYFKGTIERVECNVRR